MQLSTRGRYAVMAIVEVAKQDGTRAISLTDIAARLELSLPYLEQLFMKLRRRGLVASVRGPGGGYRLTRGAAAISVGEVMIAAGEPVKMTRCMGETQTGCVASNRCTTHRLWDALGSNIEQFLSSVSLEDVLHGKYAAPETRLEFSLKAVKPEAYS